MRASWVPGGPVVADINYNIIWNGRGGVVAMESDAAAVVNCCMFASGPQQLRRVAVIVALPAVTVVAWLLLRRPVGTFATRC